MKTTHKIIKTFRFNNLIIDIWENDNELIICANGRELEIHGKLTNYLINEGFLDDI